MSRRAKGFLSRLLGFIAAVALVAAGVLVVGLLFYVVRSVMGADTGAAKRVAPLATSTAGFDYNDEAGRAYSTVGPTKTDGLVVVRGIFPLGGSPFVRLVVEVPENVRREESKPGFLHALGAAHYSYRAGDEVCLGYVNMVDEVDFAHIRLASPPVWRAPRIPMVEERQVEESSWLITGVGEPWGGGEANRFGPAHELQLKSVGLEPARTAAVWVGDPAMTGVLNYKGLRTKSELVGTMFPTITEYRSPYADFHDYYLQFVVADW